jgi:hypothetical protein
VANPTSPSAKFILRGQALGFSIIIGAVWVAELLHAPHRLFGDAAEFNWLRVALRTALLLGIWLAVHVTTSRLLKRLHELEGFLLICGWCRRVGDQGEWLSVEKYFDTRFRTSTSHGICPQCSRRQLDSLPAATRIGHDPDTPVS